MIRWLWKIIVGNSPDAAPIACARQCQWNEGIRRQMFDADRTGLVDEWFVQRCETCGILRHHVVMKDGYLQP